MFTVWISFERHVMSSNRVAVGQSGWQINRLRLECAKGWSSCVAKGFNCLFIRGKEWARKLISVDWRGKTNLAGGLDRISEILKSVGWSYTACLRIASPSISRCVSSFAWGKGVILPDPRISTPHNQNPMLQPLFRQVSFIASLLQIAPHSKERRWAAIGGK